MVVVVFSSTDCPVANALAPEVERIHRDLQTRGGRLFVVHTNTMLSEAISQLRMVSPEHAKQISRDMRVKPQIRSKAGELVNRRGSKIQIGRR